MLQLLFTFRGAGRVWVDGRWKPARANTVYLTPPEVAHAYENVRKWEVGWIIYTEQRTAEKRTQPQLISADTQPLEWILRGLYHEANRQQESHKVDAWAELMQSYATRIIQPPPHHKLESLWELVRQNPSHPWTLENLAQREGVGPEQLRRLCRKETGYSPMHYVARLRMEAAIYLLRAGYKVEASAHAVGYDNSFAFSVAFKRLMGISPSRL